MKDGISGADTGRLDHNTIDAGTPRQQIVRRSCLLATLHTRSRSSLLHHCSLHHAL
jgi:hypothetical protein